MISTLKIIWNLLLKLVLFVVIILIILFVAPRLFGIKPYMVASSSMVPKHPVGALVYSKKVGFDEIKKGDSITFYLDEGAIVATHQVYKIDRNNNIFYTLGINNKDENGKIIKDVRPVKYKSVIGKVILTIPYLGYINKLITNNTGRYVVIAILILIIVISHLLDFVLKKDGGKEEKNGTKEK